MAETKEATMDLKSELAELDGLDGSLDTSTDVSADMVDLKNRMDISDQEMRAMTEAMKSTLLDVRTLMQDMDNPFNMLRDMGVDKLVNKAVETVEDEVNKQKNEDAKKRMAGDEDDDQSPMAVKVDGSTASSPGHVASAAPRVEAPLHRAVAPTQQAVATPIPAQGSSVSQAGAIPISAPVSPTPQAGVTPISALGSPTPQAGVTPIAAPGLPVSQSVPSTPVQGSTAGGVSQVPVSGGQAQESISGVTQATGIEGAVHSAPSSMGHASVAPQYSYMEDRMVQTEATVGQIASTVGELVKALKAPSRQTRPVAPGLGLGISDSEDYYDVYVSLVSEYMYLRLGDRGAEELLLEGMYKEWASPHVVRDIMDKMSSKKRRSKPVSAKDDIEDRMLITTLLRNLDKPVSNWGASAHLFLLMALVSRARENNA